MEEDILIDFDMTTRAETIIKVIGVGGGGGNAVNHMYAEGIKDVSYLICNTDRQALNGSPIQDKLVLGEGLGAGNHPDKAREAAESSVEAIRNALDPSTKMVFVTAGMGGGTGTGAAPIVARVAREQGLLTIGIVTIPFSWEGDMKIYQALQGVDEMSKNVDALLVINNDILPKLYHDISVLNGFKKADDVLCVAAKSIAEIITVPGYINTDFADVRTILKDGGEAVMSVGTAEGKDRVKQAMNQALHSPLLNNNNLYTAKKIFFNIACSHESELQFGEMEQIKEFMSQFDDAVEDVIWGISLDESLGKQIKVTLIASGFGHRDHPQLPEDDRAIQERHRRKLLRDRYYGSNDLPPRNRGYEPRILSPKELDNIEVIETMIEEPANKRKL